ncbi:MAG TPA: hypothetical protein VHD56_18865, partial [Tepidisphaeraceae bacterium]|nr:hypothetical protein [Tepidisphaeraceae bacterium]
MLRRTWFVAAMFCVLTVAGSAMAQNQGGGGFGGNGGGGGGFGGGGRRGGGRGGDPAAFMQNRLEQIKQDLAASDDEWKVLQPKVQDVLTAQTEANSGGRGGGGRRGGGG